MQLTPASREPLEQLRARRSRRIITSALDDQLAMDGGPVPAHSLFTGCLIEAMTGGLVASTGHQTVTGSEIGHYVQRRVSEYPGSAQTPDFGALELDDRGELLVHVRSGGAGEMRPAIGDPTIAGPASDPPDAGGASLPARRRGPFLLIGGGAVMAIIGGIVAALVTMRNTASVEDETSARGGPSDAGGVVATPPDGAPAVTSPDAGQHETTRDTLQQSSKGVDDANPTEADRAPVDDRGN